MPQVGMNPQAMIAQQNSNMEALERRRERERARDGSGGVGVGVSISCPRRSVCLICWLLAQQRPGPPRLDDDESAGPAISFAQLNVLHIDHLRR